MKQIKNRNVSHWVLGALMASIGYMSVGSHDAHAQSSTSDETTLAEIKQINNEISRLNALTAKAEQRLKLLQAENMIDQALREGKAKIVNESEKSAEPDSPAPDVALITGSGSALRAVMRYRNGTSDEVWIGKRLPGGYTVYSISSSSVRLKDKHGKIIVAGVAAPIPESRRSANRDEHNAQTTPGNFPRGPMPMGSQPTMMPPQSASPPPAPMSPAPVGPGGGPGAQIQQAPGPNGMPANTPGRPDPMATNPA